MAAATPVTLGWTYIFLLLAALLSTASTKDGARTVGPANQEDVATPTEQREHKSVEPETLNTSTDQESIKKRGYDHITKALHLNEITTQEQEVSGALNELNYIYQTKVRPAGNLYRYNDLDDHIVTESEIYSKPMVLFIGPWGSGKSTMINYLAGIEDPNHQVHTGAQPTTTDFTVLLHGEKYKAVEGLVLAADDQQPFRSLENYGQGFLERFQGFEIPSPFLKKVLVVDTPGIIENRKQQERGYPFNEVTRWFIDRADLIFVVFDPTKLDVGSELEALFKQLKGRESQLRIILNKADTIQAQELMRVYGALFWSLAPLINVTEPPRVYISSFWDKPLRINTHHALFVKEEASLLHDIQQMIQNRIENRVAFIRQHAIRVKIHMLIVAQFLQTFNNKRSFLADQEALMRDIVENPRKYHIHQSILAHSDISKYDFPDLSAYREFFAVNAINTFQPITYHCSFMNGCIYDKLDEAIKISLPQLITKLKPKEYCMSPEDCAVSP